MQTKYIFIFYVHHYDFLNEKLISGLVKVFIFIRVLFKLRHTESLFYTSKEILLRCNG